jgi:hypothetical protein
LFLKTQCEDIGGIMLKNNKFSGHALVKKLIILIITVLLVQLVSMPMIQAQSLKVNDISEDSFYFPEYFDLIKSGQWTWHNKIHTIPEVAGYMTGGGGVGNARMKDKENKFHLESLTTATCTDDPSIKPNPPASGFDSYEGKGTGSYNGVPGALAQWKFTDAGEPGNNDFAMIKIWDSRGKLVLSVSGLITGNHQSHKGTVTSVKLVSIAVIPTNPTIALGQTQKFTAKGTYLDGGVKG